MAVEVPMKLSQVHVSKWEPPAFPFYKVNVDAAIFKEQKKLEAPILKHELKKALLGFPQSPNTPPASECTIESVASHSSLIHHAELHSYLSKVPIKL